MADDTYVQAIRYEGDISDIQRKLNTLAGDTDTTESKTKTSAGKMSTHWDGVRNSVKAIAIGIGLLGGAALLAAPKILEGGANFEALDSKAKTVFGPGSIAAVNSWAASVAGGMGLTKTQAVAAAASFADLMKPMGFNSAESASMAQEIVGLSGALSAWSGGTKSAAEIAEIMSAAMLGESDALQGLGINLSAADVQARLAKNGQANLTGEALKQATALATQQLIMENSTDAQKAWADGSMDAVKKQNTMKASVEQVKESFTRALYPAMASILPVVTSLANWFGTHLPGAIATLREWISGATEWIGEHKTLMASVAVLIGGVVVAAFGAWAIAAGTAAVATIAAAAPVIAIGLAIGALAAGVIYAYQHFEVFRTTVDAVRDFIVDGLLPAFSAIYRFISDNVIPVIKTLIEVWIWPLVTAFKAIKTTITDFVVPAFQAIYNTIATVATFVGEQISAIVGFVTGIPARIGQTVSLLWNGIRDGISGAKNWVSDRIDDIVGFATGLPARMAGVFVGMWDGIKDAFKSALNWVIDKWNSIDFGINISVPGWVPGVGGKGFKVDDIFPDIPRFHGGGTVPGLVGSRDVLALVQPGETVRTPAQEAQLPAGKAIHVEHMHVYPPTGTTTRFVQELWRVAG